MNKRKSRGAKFAEGEQAVCLTPASAERNGGHPPVGTVLRATKRNGAWAYQVQVRDTDRIETWAEDTMGRLQV